VHTDDATQDGELNTTLRDAMWRGHGGWEMALTPALFGFLGWLIDGWLGTSPFLMILAAILGLAGSVANQYRRYVDRMNVVSQERLAAREAKFPAAEKRFSKNEASE
jgi:hypothetical protein